MNFVKEIMSVVSCVSVMGHLASISDLQEVQRRGELNVRSEAREVRTSYPEPLFDEKSEYFQCNPFINGGMGLGQRYSD